MLEGRIENFFEKFLNCFSDFPDFCFFLGGGYFNS